MTLVHKVIDRNINKVVDENKPDSLSKELDDLAKDGWNVISISPWNRIENDKLQTPITKHYLRIILQRRSKVTSTING